MFLIRILIGILIASSYAEYFEISFEPCEESFVIKLTDPALIQEARRILNQEEDRSLLGKVIAGRALYNADWNFHVETIEFFEFAIEVCDAAPTYVEDHLDEVGGAFLPNRIWCPWSSRLSRELVSVPEWEHEL